MLWEGFYHDFSTKKVSASPRGSAPWTPTGGGTAPWTPEVTSSPLTIYPVAAPGVTYAQPISSVLKSLLTRDNPEETQLG